MTRIAQIEGQARTDAFRSVNLVEIAGEVVELYDAAAEQDDTHLAIVGDCEVLVTGDRDLIFDAIANVVDNAIKHGRNGGHVAVRVENTENGPLICHRGRRARNSRLRSASMSSSASIDWSKAVTRRGTVSA